jgi:hypothetical protein
VDCFLGLRPPRNDARGESPQGLKGGKFEMNRSQCPVQKS